MAAAAAREAGVAQHKIEQGRILSVRQEGESLRRAVEVSALLTLPKPIDEDSKRLGLPLVTVPQHPALEQQQQQHQGKAASTIETGEQQKDELARGRRLWEGNKRKAGSEDDVPRDRVSREGSGVAGNVLSPP
ncbi:hypothetical protein cyc_05025 [Cyclospora cayetanensis]|uniref:Uncharacterized protein n=1 Tax=Cyclospora cayetanensis TaxID=88456 RepID=A0A1D3D8W7_9EIME|nr:hypothetical protein cyc_05025 [Cyclospora cayetanensis]